jgi:hypothetical protein
LALAVELRSTDTAIPWIVTPVGILKVKFFATSKSVVVVPPFSVAEVDLRLLLENTFVGVPQSAFAPIMLAAVVGLFGPTVTGVAAKTDTDKLDSKITEIANRNIFDVTKLQT